MTLQRRGLFLLCLIGLQMCSQPVLASEATSELSRRHRKAYAHAHSLSHSGTGVGLSDEQVLPAVIVLWTAYQTMRWQSEWFVANKERLAIFDPLPSLTQALRLECQQLSSLWKDPALVNNGLAFFRAVTGFYNIQQTSDTMLGVFSEYDEQCPIAKMDSLPYSAQTLALPDTSGEPKQVRVPVEQMVAESKALFDAVKVSVTACKNGLTPTLGAKPQGTGVTNDLSDEAIQTAVKAQMGPLTQLLNSIKNANIVGQAGALRLATGAEDAVNGDDLTYATMGYAIAASEVLQGVARPNSELSKSYWGARYLERFLQKLAFELASHCESSDWCKTPDVPPNKAGSSEVVEARITRIKTILAAGFDVNAVGPGMWRNLINLFQRHFRDFNADTFTPLSGFWSLKARELVKKRKSNEFCQAVYKAGMQETLLEPTKGNLLKELRERQAAGAPKSKARWWQDLVPVLSEDKDPSPVDALFFAEHAPGTTRKSPPKMPSFVDPKSSPNTNPALRSALPIDLPFNSPSGREKMSTKDMGKIAARSDPGNRAHMGDDKRDITGDSSGQSIYHESNGADWKRRFKSKSRRGGRYFRRGFRRLHRRGRRAL